MATVELTPVGKLFFASLISWIAHDSKLNWKLKGDPDKVQALAKAIVASKIFQQEIKKEGNTVQGVIEKLNLKNIAAAEYEKVTGQKFPL